MQCLVLKANIDKTRKDCCKAHARQGSGAILRERTVSFFRYCAVLCLFAASLSTANADIFRVTLISSHDGGTYQRVIDTITTHIDEQSQHTILLEAVSLDDFNQHSTAIDRTSDLLIPIGIRATDSIVQHPGSTSILATLVPRSSFNASRKKITSEMPLESPRNISAILLDQPIERQLNLTRLLFGNVKRIGIPLGLSSQLKHDEIENIARQFNLSIEIENIDPVENLIHQISRLLDRSDALLALPNPVIFNRRNVRYILLSTYRKRIPVIGFSKSYVKAGALAATYSSPEQIGKQTAEAIISLQKKPAREFPAAAPPIYFSVAINEQVARSFGYTGLSAQQLARKISQLEREEQ
ncbi:MAG: hypothetical protein L3K24_05865 [Gammaproteobacteria bacterium]|nr:hypothetical protein [Gammaproteobacteria bacterium]